MIENILGANMGKQSDARRCVIICAGGVTKWDVDKCDVTSNDYIIAADAGLLRAQKMNITPHLIVGDFDSTQCPEGGDIPIERHPTQKDDTDCILAVRRGLSLGYENFVILGGLGGRLDHTIANIQTLRFLLDHGCEGLLIGEYSTLRLLMGGEISLPPQEGYLSLFALEEDCVGLYTRGLEYSVEDVTLTTSFPLGVSNRFVAGQTATIGLRSGILMIMTVIEG